MGVGTQHLELGKVAQGRADKEEFRVKRQAALTKMGKQVAKDYVAFPALSALSPAGSYRKTVTANLLANVIRNIWSNAVIFLRSLRRCREVHEAGPGERDARTVVPATDAGQCQL